jgi:CheY-like chemotaxis protein
LPGCGFIIVQQLKSDMRIERAVLLIDDDKDDLELLQQALSGIDIEHRIIEAGDGIQGLNILNELMAQKKLPCLIVLDVNMPRMDGRETLVKIKSDPTLSRIPIVAFSTSSSQLDISFFEKHNTAYFVKPIKFDELKKTAERLISICIHRSSHD